MKKRMEKKEGMMNYEIDSVERIAQHFETISRQRVHQLLKKFKERGDEEIVAKLQQAQKLVREWHYERKYGYKKNTLQAARLWATMCRRVGKARSYKDCTIAWKSQAEFRQWAVAQVGYGVEGFELDKDILVKGNRVYGPDTCVFVPQEINMLFSGCYKAGRRGKYPIGVSFNKGSGTFVAQMSNRQELGLDKYLGSFATVEEAFACYKAAKEAKIKKLAEKWKDQIDPRAYKALMERTVELDD